MKNVGEAMERRKTLKRAIFVLAAFIWAGLFFTLAVQTTSNNEIPATMNMGMLKWSLNFGSGYTNAPTPPIVQGDSVYVGVNDELMKIDKETGKVTARVELVDSFGFATAALTYAENVDGKNVIFAPISEGRVQAVDADKMTSLWVTEMLTGQSCLSRVVYDEGYIYYGTWKSEISPGMFLCFSTEDQIATNPSEIKKPVWRVEHNGGFYWSEACTDGEVVLFGSEDGAGGQLETEKEAYLFSCLKGATYVSAKKAADDSPIVDQEPIRGDVRSGIVFDSATNAYYFTTSPGKLYKRHIDSDGKILPASDTPQMIELGGVTTGTPTIADGKIYVGIQGPTKFGSTGHRVVIIDGATLTMDDSCETPGFVQSEMLLLQGKKEDGGLDLYMAYNQLPGGLYVVKINEAAGKKVILKEGTANYFIPPDNMQNYGISTLAVDDEDTLYYKNDSCFVMAIKKAIFI